MTMHICILYTMIWYIILIQTFTDKSSMMLMFVMFVTVASSASLVTAQQQEANSTGALSLPNPRDCANR